MRQAFATLALLGVASAVHIDPQSTGLVPSRDNLELAQVRQDYRSTVWSDFIHVNFENRSDETIQMYWYDYQGNLEPYAVIAAGHSYRQWTYATHPWEAKGVNGSSSTFTTGGDNVYVPVATDNEQTFVIEKDVEASTYRSTRWSEPVQLNFVNDTDSVIRLWWHDYSGVLRHYHTIDPNQQVNQWTYATHPWSATNDAGEQLLMDGERVFVTEAGDDQADITVTKENGGVDYCVPQGEHLCMCGDVEHPIIIEGDSVRVGPKQFSDREIAQLKTIREGQTVSTYEIFESLDQTTRDCGFEFGAFEIKDPWGEAKSFKGQHQFGTPNGVATYEDDETILIGTVLNNESHGVMIRFNKGPGRLELSEFRNQAYTGLATVFVHGTIYQYVFDDDNLVFDEVNPVQPFWDEFEL